MDEKYMIQVLLQFFKKIKTTTAAAEREICAMEGEGPVSERKARLLFQKFKDGDFSHEDKAYVGSPSTLNSEAVVSNTCTSPRQLPKQLGIPQPMILHKVHKLGKAIVHKLHSNRIMLLLINSVNTGKNTETGEY